MPFFMVKDDITKIKTDAVVNAANPTLLGGGGVDGAIHRAAGPNLLRECASLGGCSTGDAVATAGYDLPAKYIIHTVGPVWQGGGNGEEALLRSCYHRSIEIAVKKGCDSVAFPLISSGAYGYPKKESLRVAVSAITQSPHLPDIRVYLVLFDNVEIPLDPQLCNEIDQKKRPPFVAEKTNLFRKAKESRGARRKLTSIEFCAPCSSEAELDSLLSNLDESFSQSLLRIIDQKGMTDAQCYKKANIDRKLFSKIRNDIHYRPSKQTAVAFAVALELDTAETDAFLKKAGYALSESNRFDVIISYFIRKKIYDIFEINQALFAYDQALLGA